MITAKFESCYNPTTRARILKIPNVPSIISPDRGLISCHEAWITSRFKLEGDLVVATDPRSPHLARRMDSCNISILLRIMEKGSSGGSSTRVLTSKKVRLGSPVKWGKDSQTCQPQRGIRDSSARGELVGGKIYANLFQYSPFANHLRKVETGTSVNTKF